LAFFGLLWELRTKYFKRKLIFSVLIVTYPLVLHIAEIRAPQWHYLDHYWWFCVFVPFFCQFLAFFGLLWDLRTKYFHRKLIFSVLIVTYPLVLHIGEIRAPQWHYLDHYWRFCVFLPPFPSNFGFLATYGTLEPNISIGS